MDTTGRTEPIFTGTEDSGLNKGHLICVGGIVVGVILVYTVSVVISEIKYIYSPTNIAIRGNADIMYRTIRRQVDRQQENII
jgi:hypothetical protein